MDVIGGGVLVAVAATLWIAYLLPSWLRRRQYLATERNAVRLQQTLRILAETAETPHAVHVEATAREVAVQQRILHEHEEAARLEAEAATNLAIVERIAAEEAAESARARAVRAMATHPIAVVPTASAAAGQGVVADAAASAPAAILTRRALRRRRGLCSLLMLCSLLVVVGGLIAAAFGAPLLIAAAGGAGMVVGFAGIVVLARRTTAPAVAAAPVAMPEAQPFEPIDVEAEPGVEAGWTPQPLPRPLHLSRGTIAATAMASIVAAEELKRVAAEAEMAARAERREPTVPVLRPQAAPAASAGQVGEAADAARPAADEPASPYARMGIIDDARPGIDDLDAVFRRRRAAV
jgi:hypothetical protein